MFAFRTSVALLVAAFWFPLIGGHSLCAQQSPSDIAIARLGLLAHLQVHDLEELNLSPEQKDKVAAFDEQADAIFLSEHYSKLLKRDAKDELAKLNEKLYQELESTLNSAQSKLLRKKVSAYYYQRESARQAMLGHKDIFYFGAPPWNEKSIAAMINLDQEIQNEVVRLLKQCYQNQVKTERKQLEEVQKFFDNWQKVLARKLDEKQLQKYKDALGEKMRFPKSLEPMFRIARFRGPLVLLDRERRIQRTMATSPYFPDLILLCNLDSRIGSDVIPESVLDLLKLREMENALEISETQRDCLADIQEQWRKVSSIAETVDIENNFGTGPHVKKETGDSALAKRRKSLHKKIQKVLNTVQKKRLRQIWNQLVLQFGWTKVPLGHPDWSRYLEFSKECKDSFKKINKTMRMNYSRLVQRHELENQKLKEQLALDLSKLLTDKQKAIVVQLFGRHWNGEGL